MLFRSREGLIEVHYKFEEEILHLPILKIMLQPFVENAILHGAEPKEGRTNIILVGKREGDALILEIIDDGVGMDSSKKLTEDGKTNGYGIRNVHDRIQLHYGQEYGVSVYSRLGIGTKVTLRFPFALW